MKLSISNYIKIFIQKNTAFIFTVPAVLWQILFLYIPLILVIYTSIQDSSSTSLWSITLDHYRMIIDWSYLHIIIRSLCVAIGVTFFCLLIAYPVAYFLALRIQSGWKNILLFLLTLPFWTNFLIQIYSWVFVLDYNGLINTILLPMGIIKEPMHMINNIYAIIIVMIYYYLPFMLMPLYSILEKIQHDVLEASLDLGATHWQTFTRITIPLSLSGIKTGVFLVFVPAFGEFAIPSIIGGGKQMFVGSLVSHYFLVVRDSNLGAAFTVISGCIVMLCAFLFHWLCKVPTSITQKEVN